MNKIWRKNFDIRQVDVTICCESMPGFGGLNYPTVEKNIIKEAIIAIENTNLTGAFFPQNELRSLVASTLYTILKDPDKIDKVHQHTIKLNREYFDYAEKVRQTNLQRLSNKAILDRYKKLFNIQFLAHCWAVPTTWYVDSDGEDFSKYLVSFLKDRIEQKNLPLDVSTAFSVLTTPKKPSLGQKEEQESLRIVDWIKSIPKLKHWFASQTTEELVKQFPTLPKNWKDKMLKHHYNWCWTPYTYIGPAYGLDYYLEVWRGLIHEDIYGKQEITKKMQAAKKLQNNRADLVKKLELSKQEKHWFDIAADIVWLKGFRKDCYFHGFYTIDLLLKEIGKRSGLSLMQAKYLLPSELPKALKGKDLSSVTNERMRFCVIYGKTPAGKLKAWTEKGIKVFTGSQAKAFLKKHKFEKVKVVKTDTLSGTCACPGSATGIVKIVNLPSEMDKMNEGDIMLAHTTFPSLVPAMKKAAAIITEDGGITCHAAIVARELQTPCLVGCKNALSILKDGDKVEVDANKGIVKKVNS